MVLFPQFYIQILCDINLHLFLETFQNVQYMFKLKLEESLPCYYAKMGQMLGATFLRVNKVVCCFDFPHYMTDSVIYFVHTVVSPLRNMAYFLLQMSSIGIYLLNCKG